MMSRFSFGIAVFVLFLFGQAGIVFAVEDGSHVTGTVSFRGPFPVGTYTIVAWHETLGSLEQEITVPPKGTKTINFVFP